MADTFTDLVTRTRDWLNRDTDVISDVILQDCIRWAADHAYRTLRIPPLESTITYTGSGTGALNLLAEPNVGGLTITSFAVPVDLIEVIKIRTVDSTGQTIRVIENKADTRTFFNPQAGRWGHDTSWTRKGGRIYVSTQVGDNSETSVEIYYYRRLPALDAVYTIVADNFDIDSTFLELATVQAGAAGTGEGFLQILDSGSNPITTNPPTASAVFASGNTAVTTLLTAVDPATGVIKFNGKTPEHWLLNENEKLLIYGGLAEAFSYVQEDDQAGKYKQYFMEELTALNDEDVRRNSAGGNLQVNFSGLGLI